MTSGDEIQVRDKRNGSWCWINNAVLADPHLTDADVRTYCALSTFANCRELRPGIQLLARRSNVSERTARRCIKRLCAVSYIRVERGGGNRTSRYTLLKAATGCARCRKTRGGVVQPLSQTAGEGGHKQQGTPVTNSRGGGTQKGGVPRSQTTEEYKNQNQNNMKRGVRQGGSPPGSQKKKKKSADRQNLQAGGAAPHQPPDDSPKKDFNDRFLTLAQVAERRRQKPANGNGGDPVQFLKQVLARGRVPVKAALAAAQSQEISEKAMPLAARQLGCMEVDSGDGVTFFWQFPR